MTVYQRSELALVSIHAPARGATTKPVRKKREMQCFNPRAREGRDTFPCQSIILRTGFNPRAREGRDRIMGAISFDESGFNPRAREGRDRFACRVTTAAWCFNPRAREGRDIMRASFNPSKLRVSIHAPARGATGVRHAESFVTAVSIHAPARGATRASGTVVATFTSFNPRAREGRDTQFRRIERGAH